MSFSDIFSNVLQGGVSGAVAGGPWGAAAGGTLGLLSGLLGKSESDRPKINLNMPQDAVFNRTIEALSLLRPEQSLLTANATRAISAQTARDRLALAGQLGPGVGSAAISRVGQIANASRAKAIEDIAGLILGKASSLGEAQAGQDYNLAMARYNASIDERNRFDKFLGKDPFASALGFLTSGDNMDKFLKTIHLGGG